MFQKSSFQDKRERLINRENKLLFVFLWKVSKTPAEWGQESGHLLKADEVISLQPRL